MLLLDMLSKVGVPRRNSSVSQPLFEWRRDAIYGSKLPRLATPLHAERVYGVASIKSVHYIVSSFQPTRVFRGNLLDEYCLAKAYLLLL